VEVRWQQFWPRMHVPVASGNGDRHMTGQVGDDLSLGQFLR
jgi:hypothetical protein